MIETTRLFDDDTTRALTKLIGGTIDSYEAYLLTVSPDSAYKCVRIHSSKGSFDITNKHATICLGPYADEEQLSIMDVTFNNNAELWCPPRKNISERIDLDFYIDDILLVVDTIALTDGDVPINELKQVQAVVFRCGAQLFAVDRDVWFDEVLKLSFGLDVDALVRDTKGDWQEEPPYGYKFNRDLISLGMGGIRI